MRLGRRLSAGIAEDPPAPAPPEPAVTAEGDARTEHAAERREPVEQLAER